jgi:hypothetical protein
MRLALIVALALTAGAASAQEAKLDHVELSKYGLYRGNPTGKIPDAGTTTGTTTLVTGVDFYEVTNMVPACRGVGFGYVFRPVGAPDGQGVTVRSVWQLPEPGLKNPDTGKTYRQSISDFQTPIGELKFRGYTFDHDWELVPGEWILEIWQGDRRLAGKAFTIYQAPCTDKVS